MGEKKWGRRGERKEQKKKKEPGKKEGARRERCSGNGSSAEQKGCGRLMPSVTEGY